MKKLVLFVGVGMAFTLTACGVTDKPAASPAPAPTASVAGLPATTAGSAPTATATATATVPNPQSTVPAASGTGCPVTADALMTALKAKGSDIYTRAASPAALHKVSCHEKFAVAATVPDGEHQPSRIAFGYDSASTTWRPLNLGSSGFCAGYVPDHLAANLAGCTS
ncbi:hypothetical protein AB0M43_01720 [Longispora sp. NPDC051575]|uniref:hypothetical protein n=1 Tax=Longispora sp. NPDC051575 TaxID=3154943 RepID=UPI003417D40F